MHTYNVQYHVDGVGNFQETIRAGSETDVRRLIRAKYPNTYTRVIQVTQID